MSSKAKNETGLLQGTLDVMILRILATMGPRHSYAISGRLEQVSEQSLSLNQGTLYPALVRLEQNGWIAGAWRKTENNRDARYYSLTKKGRNALESKTERWRRSAGLVNKVLLEEL
jgi:PadR family transcriptional regulator, regulatory protein PadR